jgi:hypothetical protein
MPEKVPLVKERIIMSKDGTECKSGACDFRVGKSGQWSNPPTLTTTSTAGPSLGLQRSRSCEVKSIGDKRKLLR